VALNRLTEADRHRRPGRHCPIACSGQRTDWLNHAEAVTARTLWPRPTSAVTLCACAGRASPITVAGTPGRMTSSLVRASFSGLRAGSCRRRSWRAAPGRTPVRSAPPARASVAAVIAAAVRSTVHRRKRMARAMHCGRHGQRGRNGRRARCRSGAAIGVACCRGSRLAPRTGLRRRADAVPKCGRAEQRSGAPSSVRGGVDVAHSTTGGRSAAFMSKIRWRGIDLGWASVIGFPFLVVDLAASSTIGGRARSTGTRRIAVVPADVPFSTYSGRSLFSCLPVPFCGALQAADRLRSRAAGPPPRQVGMDLRTTTSAPQSSLPVTADFLRDLER